MLLIQSILKMRTSFIAAFLLFVFILVQAQELKKKKIQGPVYTEVFQINKETKKKQGDYLKILNFSKDTLVKGNFENDSVAGVWTYFDKNNHPRLKYNFSTDSCVWISEMASKSDTFSVRIGKNFGFTRLDRPPLYIGFFHDPAIIFQENIKPPIEMMEKGESVLEIASFIVNKNGNIAEINTEEIKNSSLRFAVEKAFRINSLRYLPGILKGQPVDTKLFVVLDIGPGGSTQMIPKKPYAIHVDLKYFGIQRTQVVRTSRVSSYGGSNIGNNRRY